MSKCNLSGYEHMVGGSDWVCVALQCPRPQADGCQLVVPYFSRPPDMLSHKRSRLKRSCHCFLPFFWFAGVSFMQKKILLIYVPQKSAR